MVLSITIKGCKNHTLFKIKMAEIDALFLTKSVSLRACMVGVRRRGKEKGRAREALKDRTREHRRLKTAKKLYPFGVARTYITHVRKYLSLGSK